MCCYFTHHCMLYFQISNQKIKNGESGKFLPFVICDVMGLENKTPFGAHIDDIKLVLEGHVKEGHKVCHTHTHNPTIITAYTLHAGLIVFRCQA